MIKRKRIRWRIDENGCWICTSHYWARGYPAIWRYGKATKISHLFYEKYRGKIPEGMFVCHHCDNPYCINPDHLFVGTNMDNMRDMVNKNRARGKGPLGESNGQSKLTCEQVLEIRTRRKSGESMASLAREFGVRPGSLWDMEAGRTWGWLKPDCPTQGGGG